MSYFSVEFVNGDEDVTSKKRSRDPHYIFGQEDEIVAIGGGFIDGDAAAAVRKKNRMLADSPFSNKAFKEAVRSELHYKEKSAFIFCSDWPLYPWIS